MVREIDTCVYRSLYYLKNQQTCTTAIRKEPMARRFLKSHLKNLAKGLLVVDSNITKTMDEKEESLETTACIHPPRSASFVQKKQHFLFDSKRPTSAPTIANDTFDILSIQEAIQAALVEEEIELEQDIEFIYTCLETEKKRKDIEKKKKNVACIHSLQDLEIINAQVPLTSSKPHTLPVQQQQQRPTRRLSFHRKRLQEARDEAFLS